MPIQRALLYIVVLCILLGGGIMAGQWDKDTGKLQEYADQISMGIAEAESEALQWFEANKVDLIRGNFQASQYSLSNRPYTILLHRGDSIVFWSNNHLIPPKKVLAGLSSATNKKLLELPAAWVFVRTQEIDGIQFSLLIPIRYASGLQAENPFPAAPELNDHVQVDARQGSALVQLEGKEICRLYAQADFSGGWLQQLQGLFYLLVFFVLLLLGGKVGSVVSARFGRLAGVGSVILLALVISLTLRHFVTSSLTALPLFAAFQQPSWLGASLGDWLLSTVLFSWIFVVIFREWKPVVVSSGLQKLLAVLAYFSMMFWVLFCAQLIRHLVINSGIAFDFDNLLNLSGYSIVAVFGVLLWLLSGFLWSQRCGQLIHSMSIPRPMRMGLMAAAGLMFAVICFAWPTGMGISPFLIILFAFLFTAAMDGFSHWETPGFGWIVVWLVLYSVISSTFLYHYQEGNKQTERFEYAKALSVDRDTQYAERLLNVALLDIQRDSSTLNTLLKPWPFKAKVEEVQDYFNRFFYQNNYLFQHYSVQVFAFDREQQTLLLGQTGDATMVITENWAKGTPISNNVRIVSDINGKFRYMFRCTAQRMNDPSQPADVFVFLDHEFPKTTRVFAQLFYGTAYKSLHHLNKYDFAVRSKGKLVVDHGAANLTALQLPISNNASKEITSPLRIDVLAASADGQTQAVVGKKQVGWTKQMYLFSILFTAISFLLLLFALLNHSLKILPDDFQLKISSKGSLAKRIHFWTVVLIGSAFLVIGWMTYRHFSAAFEETEHNDLDYRANALFTNLENQALSSTLSSDSLNKTLRRSLGAMAASLSVDAQLYDPAGNLSFTTQADLAGLGILSSKINPIILYSNPTSVAQEQNILERVGTATFMSKYMPIYTGRQQILGYLSVPYQLNSSRTGAEVSDFIGILASLYVFLLLLAYVITYFLARSITRPVALISEKIRQIKLEDKNELLEYKGDAQDELSELIEQYNTMVLKLEDSKVQMIRLEREGAWREMARQVAHDIKNPLTTMKLSMQQLERVSSNPEQAAAYLRKAITRLIEQIDSLAQIASEFSMFANLDIRQKNDMVLNEIVENVHDLFSEQKNVDLNLSLPNERFHVLGDKNHLIRVFNNLVINAIQAIPSDRRGLIKVAMYRDGKTAVVRISDNGGGIPLEIRQRVFEPNFTTKTSGSGLGLAICKKIIEAHDGNILFETKDDVGTDFFVEIPIASSEPLST
jgi:two-component system nitrogen regulation sensor histidine kinase NtrY